MDIYDKIPKRAGAVALETTGLEHVAVSVMLALQHDQVKVDLKKKIF